MTRDKHLAQAIANAGGATRLAEALNIAQASVSGWRRTPAARVLEVEKITGVSRHELRPDLYPEGV